MTKEEIFTVINYALTTNVKDWRTIICIVCATIFTIFIITKLVIKIFFKEMDFKIPMEIWVSIAAIFATYIVVALSTFAYNYTCYERDFVVIPLLNSGNYVDAFDVMGEYDFKDYIILREEYHEEYTYQLADKLKDDGKYIDAFVNYYEIITFRDSRKKAEELIPYITEELSK